jgi:hypothetical protein
MIPWGWDDAAFSEDGRHRYTLTRAVDGPLLSDASKRLLFIMLNPSTADASLDDPTIRRCIGFAKSWGFGRLAVVNLFSFRSTDPSVLSKVDDAEGDPENATTILQLAQTADLVVCAWGVHGELRERDLFVTKLLTAEGIKLHHLGLTLRGHPKHPLYLKGDTTPVPWTPGEKPPKAQPDPMEPAPITSGHFRFSPPAAVFIRRSGDSRPPSEVGADGVLSASIKVEAEYREYGRVPRRTTTSVVLTFFSNVAAEEAVGAPAHSSQSFDITVIGRFAEPQPIIELTDVYWNELREDSTGIVTMSGVAARASIGATSTPPSVSELEAE